MKNELVLKRFEELANKAQLVATTRFVSKGYSYVDQEKFHEWATSALNLLQNIFGTENAHYKNFTGFYSAFKGYSGAFFSCKGIFNAAREDYEGGYLFNAKTLISAELLDDVLEQSTELLKAGYKDPACVIAGVVLETTLKKLCEKKQINHSKLDRMNTELCKIGVYNIGMQKQITTWADRRNNAAHGNWAQYNEKDVEDMIIGINRFLAEYL